jgi:ketosteroid isomerase-like protein
MSEQGNVQVVQEAYAAYKRGDIQTILDRLTKDVKWIAPGVEPIAGTYHGPDEVARFFRQVNEISEFSSFEPDEYVAQGDRVVVLGHYQGIARNTGRVYECDWAMAFTVQDGKISKFQEYTDTAALAVALQIASPAGA